MASTIIAAYNEAETIASVIDSIKGHPQIDEIIVVDDGSSDQTSQVAREKGVTVITLPENKGKAYAMDIGVKAAKNDIIFFSDADISGLTHQKISDIITPVVTGKLVMNVGIRSRKIFLFNYWLRICPIIGGERAIVKSLWDKVPDVGKDSFKIEIALNYTAKQTALGMGFVVLHGVTQRIKEKKQGLIRGFWNRIKMTGEVMSIGIRLYVFGRIFPVK